MTDWHIAWNRMRPTRANHAPASSAVPIPISSSRVRSAARGAAVPRKPVSCKFSPHSLDDGLAGHLRVNRAEIRIRSRLAEREGKLFVRIEHFGLERFWIVRADHRMGNIVSIGPRYRGTHGNRQRRRPEAEVIDLHLCRFRLLLRARQEVLLPSSKCSDSEQQRHNESCNRHTSPHVFLPLFPFCRSDWFGKLTQFPRQASVESTTASACCP